VCHHHTRLVTMTVSQDGQSVIIYPSRNYHHATAVSQTLGSGHQCNLSTVCSANAPAESVSAAMSGSTTVSSDAVTGQPLVIMHITQCRSACNALMVITVPFNTVKKVKDLGFWRRHNVGCRYNSLPSCFRALCAVVLSPSANTNVLNLRHYCCHVSCNTDTAVCVEVDTKLRRTSAEDVLTKERM